jgi:hypothetical protein
MFGYIPRLHLVVCAFAFLAFATAPHIRCAAILHKQRTQRGEQTLRRHCNSTQLTLFQSERVASFTANRSRERESALAGGKQKKQRKDKPYCICVLLRAGASNRCSPFPITQQFTQTVIEEVR